MKNVDRAHDLSHGLEGREGERASIRSIDAILEWKEREKSPGEGKQTSGTTFSSLCIITFIFHSEKRDYSRLIEILDHSFHLCSGLILVKILL